MAPTLEARRHAPSNAFGPTPLALGSGFGTLDGDALDLVERRYGDRELAVSSERYSSRRHEGDIVCTARSDEQIVGTLSVRFDGTGGLHADLHAHRRARCERLVIEVNPRHVGFCRRCLGLIPLTAARHNPRVDAPAVLMSIDFATIREQIALWGGQPDRLASARSLYPLGWDEATEATMLARLS